MTEASNAVRAAERPAPPALARAVLSRAPNGLVRFLGVGVGGLSVDIAILWLLERAGLGHEIARVGSLSVATFATWALNRQFTFGDSGRKARSEFGRYALVALVAQSVNYGIFLAVLAVVPTMIHSIAAVIGAVVATLFSYTGQRFFTFSPGKRPPESGQ